MLNSQVDEIKNRLDIVEVISGYIKLQKAGANFKASCPFHNEKTPSLMVSPSRQIWHCFGCGAGGDIFGFVIKMENLEFPEALKILADKAGVVLRREDPKLRSEKTRLFEVCEAAAKFFEYCLANGAKSKEVVEYLLNRGLTDETVKEFRLGFAPDSWDSLLRFLTSRGFRGPEIEKTGLIIKSGKGVGSRQFYDRFRSRIMFPICNPSGQVVGFSGRIFRLRPSGYGGQVGGEDGEEKEAKYVNTPNTLLYDKSRILYGFDKSKSEIRKTDSCFLVEGQMDLIMAWQDGVKNICATSGTALTPDHLSALKRCTENLILGFDMDEAGQMATSRGIDLALAGGFNIKVVTLQEGKDPADFVKERPGQLLTALEAGRPIMEYYFERVFHDNNLGSIEEKKKIAAALLPQIKKIYNKIEQAHWLEELSRRIASPVESLAEELKKIKSGQIYKPEIFEASVAVPPRQEMLAERLMALVLRCPEHRDCLDGLEADLPAYFSQLGGELKNSAGDFSFGAFYQKLPPDLQKKADYLILKADYEAELNPAMDFKKEAVKTICELNMQKIKDNLKRLGEDIKQAQETNQGDLAASKSRDFQEQAIKLENLNKKN